MDPESTSSSPSHPFGLEYQDSNTVYYQDQTCSSQQAAILRIAVDQVNKYWSQDRQGTLASFTIKKIPSGDSLETRVASTKFGHQAIKHISDLAEKLCAAYQLDLNQTSDESRSESRLSKLLDAIALPQTNSQLAKEANQKLAQYPRETK